MGSIKPPGNEPPRYKGKCPVCGAPGEHATRPFCSRRCADVDLSRWLRGGYAIQGIAGSFVVKMVGSYTNVVGLPLTEVVSLLQGEGFPVSHLWLSKAEVETE